MESFRVDWKNMFECKNACNMFFNINIIYANVIYAACLKSIADALFDAFFDELFSKK